MVDPSFSLPGLEHLITVLKSHGVRVELHPPHPATPHAGDLVQGKPFDPILAAVYARSNGGHFGDLCLYPARSETPGGDIVQDDSSAWVQPEERLQKILLYAGFDGFAYELATIPSLATPDGIQPVIYLDTYEEPFFQPIASNVDRAFDLYAYYCDAQIKSAGSLSRVSDENILFPEYVVSHIARDSRLVRMLEEGKFDEFVAPNPDSREWVERILKIALKQG